MDCNSDASCLCLDPSWSRKLVDHSLLGYGTAVEPTILDSDDDEEDEDDASVTQYSATSPRNVRRAESLEGPYSLLSLPLPSDAPDFVRQGSDRGSPGASSSSVVPSRSSRSLDQRLDELFAKGKLGDGMSPPSSISDQQSDVESDSLSEEELDIIKLRKPVTVTLPPVTSSASHSTPSQPKSSDRKSDGKKVDRVTPPAEDNGPLTDDMVDQIVRMKPMMAKAARQPSLLDCDNSPEDLSLKTHHNVPVDLSSKPCSSEKATSVFSDPMSLCISTTSTSVDVSTAVGSGLTATTSLPVSTSRSHSSHRSADPRLRLSTIVTESQSALSSGDVQIQTEASDKKTKTVSTLISPSPILPVPSVSSIQHCATSSSISGSASADADSSCQKRASDQKFGQLESDGTLDTASRYHWNFVTWW